MLTMKKAPGRGPCLLALAATLLLSPLAWAQQGKTNNVKAPSGNSPLADVFAGDDGGAYYVSEVGKHVYWFAEHPGRDYAHVFHGTREGNQIKGRYWSIPKDRATTHGQLTVKVNPNGSLTRVSETGGFPSKSFSVTTIDHITQKLPGPREHAAFTKNTLEDLDGLYVDSHKYHYYVRQLAEDVVFVAEPAFKAGTRPEGVYVFVGERHGHGIQGQVVASPKGKATGSKAMQLNVQPGRVLARLAGLNFGGGPLLPILPDIKLPIAKVMDALNSQVNKVHVRLDGYEKDGKELKDGSFIRFGNRQANFSIPMFEVDLGRIKRRSFINDMESDVVHLSSQGPNSTRLTVIFETKGKEIKRYEKGGLGGDKIMADWQIENPRVDIVFKLINHKTSKGEPSISYEVTDVDVQGKIDAKLLGDGIENWISGKIRPKVESAIKGQINDPTFRRELADEIHNKLLKLDQYVMKATEFGYLLSNLVPKEIAIEGDQLVFKFH